MISLNTIVLIPDWLSTTASTRHFNLGDLSKLILNISNNETSIEEVRKAPLSIKTVYEVIYLNTLMSAIIDNIYTTPSICDGSLAYIIKNNLTPDMEKDCKNSINSCLSGKEQLECCVDVGDEQPKYYEIQTTPEGIMIIVVCPGFLNYLVESKDNFNKFILECLQLTYDYSSFTVDQPITRLLGSYLYYNSNDNYKQIFKANLSSFLI